MNKIKLAITRYDLTRFFFYAEENGIRFNGDYDIYDDSIYFSGAFNSIQWSEEELNDGEIEILISMINKLVKSHELYFKGE